MFNINVNNYIERYFLEFNMSEKCNFFCAQYGVDTWYFKKLIIIIIKITLEQQFLFHQ